LISAGAPPHTPLGELTALPRPLYLRGLLLRGGGDKGGEEEMGREERGKGRGEEERGREGNRTTQNLVATPLNRYIGLGP